MIGESRPNLLFDGLIYSSLNIAVSNLFEIGFGAFTSVQIFYLLLQKS